MFGALVEKNSGHCHIIGFRHLEIEDQVQGTLRAASTYAFHLLAARNKKTTLLSSLLQHAAIDCISPAAEPPVRYAVASNRLGLGSATMSSRLLRSKYCFSPPRYKLHKAAGQSTPDSQCLPRLTTSSLRARRTLDTAAS